MGIGTLSDVPMSTSASAVAAADAGRATVDSDEPSTMPVPRSVGAAAACRGGNATASRSPVERSDLDASLSLGASSCQGKTGA